MQTSILPPASHHIYTTIVSEPIVETSFYPDVLARLEGEARKARLEMIEADDEGNNYAFAVAEAYLNCQLEMISLWKEGH